jgi:cytochrome c biogenesis protein CcdA
VALDRLPDWPWPVWGLYALGVLYLVGFAVFFVLIERGARRAARGNPEEVARFNRLLRGFPNALYARMLGRRPLEMDERSV